MKGHPLQPRRLGLDTYRQPVVYMRSDCSVCRAEGFEALTRVEVRSGTERVVATLNVVTSDLLQPGEVGLSEEAWRLLGSGVVGEVRLLHPPPLDSFRAVRAKMYGHRLDESGLTAIVRDIKTGNYPDVHIAAFLTACAGDRLDTSEMTALTRVMIEAGERLEWGDRVVVDKHCVGGLPGNRTTPIIVGIVAAAGLTIPKTSSRAITSPAGTADVMETMCPVELDLATMRRVVELEGGCLTWGGAVGLSPVDDLLIRVERALDVDGEGQLVASVLSKKAAAGASHVLIDIPWGPTAKVRSPEAASGLAGALREVGAAVGLTVTVRLSDGTQPVGRGIGPALEARDVLAVLRRGRDAPCDLRNRSLDLAGRVLAMAGAGDRYTAALLLDSGEALHRFLAICEAQGGFREPPRASLIEPILSTRRGRVRSIDNRALARLAKLAGAPAAPTAGLELHARVGDFVEPGQPLLSLHAQNPGERDYALDYASSMPDIFRIEEAA